MAKFIDGKLALDPEKRERFAVVITGGDTNANGLADLTVELVTDPPGAPSVHMGPFTKDLPVAEVMAVVHAGLTMMRVPGVAQAQVDMVVGALRAAARLP